MNRSLCDYLREITISLTIFLSACGPAAAGTAPPTKAVQTNPVPTQTTSFLPSLTATLSATPTSNLTQTLAEDERQATLLLANAIDDALSASAAEWHIQIQTLDGKVLYTRLSDDPVYIDKLIHLPLAMLYLKGIESNNVTEIKKYLTAHGDYTTTLRQTLFESTVYDSQVAAKSLLTSIPDYGLNIIETLSSWEAAGTNLQHGQSTAGDLSRLMAGLYGRRMLSEESTILILDMLDQGVLSDDPLRDMAPAGTIIHDKRELISGQGSMLAEAAVIDTGHIVYLVTILGLGNDSSLARYADLLQTYEKIAATFWVYTGTR